MSEPNQPDGPEDEPTPPEQTTSADEAADRLVGRYTEVDGDGPLVRGVAGEYTRKDGTADDETEVGDYTSTQKDPHTHDASERPGKYTRADHGEPHHHKHHDE
jgi:hypothetical protein